EADLGDGDVEVVIGAQTIRGLSRYYAQGSGLMALVGSSGYLEIATREANASLQLGVVVGEEVLVTGLKSSRGRKS
ncbi:MAG: S-adenosyl-l-methionine hydroxide adenosyltransferase, partial [Dehalococcoidia bacterium]|nr:S-adenosyl-l-methionine hydroxide adenosyltransferase [Dehalococcoidia bacterium]